MVREITSMYRIKLQHIKQLNSLLHIFIMGWAISIMMNIFIFLFTIICTYYVPSVVGYFLLFPITGLIQYFSMPWFDYLSGPIGSILFHFDTIPFSIGESLSFTIQTFLLMFFGFSINLNLLGLFIYFFKNR
jgi:hypothetical protein